MSAGWCPMRAPYDHDVASEDAQGRAAFAVVGGGIVGLATARELQRRHPGERVVVLEREAAVGRHQTGANSGVAHAGIYYKAGSLKARLCVEGLRDLYAFCEEHGVAHERCGKVIVALDERERAGLDELEARGRANGVPGLRRLDARGLAEVEPHAAGVDALHSPHTGIVDFGAVAARLAQLLREDGATVATGCTVLAVERRDGATVVRHSGGELRARRVVTCAGAWSDRLAVAAGADPDPRIVPFRGAYLRLVPERRGLGRALIYPVPDPALPFLGVHLTRRIDGEVLVGPTALLGTEGLGRTLAWPGSWRLFRRWWRTGLTEIGHATRRRALVAEAARYLPGIGVGDVEPSFAGVRAQAVARDGSLVDDFAFSKT